MFNYKRIAGTLLRPCDDNCQHLYDILVVAFHAVHSAPDYLFLLSKAKPPKPSRVRLTGSGTGIIAMPAG